MLAETCTGLEQGVALEVIVSLHCSCTLSHVLFFPQLAISLHCMLTAHVRTEAYSSAKINECIDFVELNTTTLYGGQKPGSTLSRKTVCDSLA